MFKLKRLKINHYRNVEPCELHFNDGFNIILGKNATGKTTLLKLIEAILCDDLSDVLSTDVVDMEYTLIVDALVAEVQLRGEQTSEPRLPIRSTRAGIIKHLDARLMLGTRRWEFTTRHDASEHQRRVDLEVEEVVGALLFDVFKPDYEDDELSGLVVRVGEQKEQIVRLDEGVGVFDVLRSVQRLGRNPEGSHFSVVSFENQREPVVLGYGPWPEDLNLQLARNAALLEKQEQIEIDGAAVPSLMKLGRALDFDNIKLTLSVLKRERQKGETWTSLGAARFSFHHRDTSVTDEFLSFGQKRYFTFLYLLACNDDVIVADELVNGLHHAWIANAVRAIGDRQAFLTSQNPILFDYIPIESLDGAARTFLTCKTIESEDGVRMVWEHLSREDAERVFEAYESGVETLGQILETRGLW